jgi:hypothetical protein
MVCEGFIFPLNFVRDGLKWIPFLRERLSFPEMDSTPPTWQNFFDAIRRLQSEMTNIEQSRQRVIHADPVNGPNLRGEEESERMLQSYTGLGLRLEEEQADAAEVEASYPIPTHPEPMRRR